MRAGQRETVTFSSLNDNVWSSSPEVRALNLTENCRARATQSPWKGWLVQKGDSCPWPHLDTHCDHLPDISSDVNVAGQWLGSENYFCCDVFQSDQVPEQAAYLHTRDKLPIEKGKAPCTEPWETDTHRASFSHFYSDVCQVPLIPWNWLISSHLMYFLTPAHSPY